MTPQQAIDRAVAKAGSQAELARQLTEHTGSKVWQGSVAFMVKEGRAKAQYVLAIEEITGISRHDLRPDVFGKRNGK